MQETVAGLNFSLIKQIVHGASGAFWISYWPYIHNLAFHLYLFYDLGFKIILILFEVCACVYTHKPPKI